jgi:hypothetical protein
MTEITVGIAYSDKDAEDPAFWPGGMGDDILIEYTREHDICTGVGTIDFIIGAEAYPPEIWSKVWVYSDLGFLSRYNVVSVEKKAPDGVWLISCQDDSKRMMDYFIDEQYEITYPSTSVYWMKKFLDEAGIAYVIDSEYGVMMSENASLGMTSCYDVITQLCQMNGWAFQFTMDEDPPNFYSSVCHIGKFSITENQSGGAHIGEHRVIELGYIKSDKMLRNRAVVWGAGDPDTGAWIWADTSTTTAWNRPDGDYRTIVYANGCIKTWGVAASLATTILNEFSQTIPEETIKCFYNYGDGWKTNEEGDPIPKTYSEMVALGYYVGLMSNVNASSPRHSIYVGGRVTHLTERMDSTGLTATYALDRRCPRLFGYAEWSDYVYIGTTGAGVWRKWITSSTWTNYSTGITDLNIKDLTAYNGLLGSVTDAGKSYIRHIQNASWAQYSPIGFTNNFVISGEVFGSEYLTSGILAEASSLDRNYGINGAITIGFTIPNVIGMEEFASSGMANRRHDLFPASGNLSWVEAIVVVSGETVMHDFGIIDLETNWDSKNLISVYGGTTISGTIHINYITPTPYDYGDVPRGGGGWNCSSPNLLVISPPPSSGIVLEPTSTDLGDFPWSGGYWIIETNVGSWGGTVIEDSEELEPKLYGMRYYGDDYWSLETHQICTASAIWNPEYEWWDFDGDYAKYYYLDITGFGDNIDTFFFNKLNDTTFTITGIDSGNFEFDTTTDTYFIEISGNDATVTDHVSNNLGPTYHYYYASVVGRMTYANSNGRYIGILQPYADEGEGDETPVTMKFKVVDGNTGGLVSEQDICSVTDHENLQGFGYTNTSPHHSIFGVIEGSPGTGILDRWEGWRVYVIIFNHNTGGFSVGQIDGPDDYPEGSWDTGMNWLFYSADNRHWNNAGGDEYIGYRHNILGIVNENPDSGAGFARIFARCIVTHTNLGAPWPFDHWTYVYGINGTVSMGGDISVEPWTDIIHNDDDERITQQESEGWMENQLKTTYGQCVGTPGDILPTFSRNISNTPIGSYAFKGDYDTNNFELILSNPDDFSEISVTKIPYPNEWGIGDFNILTNVWPMLDDVENLLYLELDDTLTVGYDLGGNIKKLFFPRTDWNQDTAYGQPIQNALFNPNPSVSHYYWFLPRVPIEYEQEIHHNYMVLYHDPLITISGGTLPSGVSVGQFDIIYHHNKPIYLDTAKNVPTVIYTKPYLDDYPSELVGVSFLNELNSFTVISPGGGMGVHDVRTFDLTDDLGLFPASGLSASGFLDRYVGVAGGHVGAVMFNSTFDREGGMFVPYAVIASGNFTHLDFTNNDPDPYIFVSASGISSSGIFLQRDKASSIWHDYSATLPSGVPITIIRADDRM